MQFVFHVLDIRDAVDEERFIQVHMDVPEEREEAAGAESSKAAQADANGVGEHLCLSYIYISYVICHHHRHHYCCHRYIYLIHVYLSTTSYAVL